MGKPKSKPLGVRMNKERMLELAEFLEKLPEEQFDMTSWVKDLRSNQGDLYYKEYFKSEYEVFDCNTVCCIAGWTVGLFNGTGIIKTNTLRRVDEDTIVKEATRLLDLTRSQAVELFYLNPDSIWDLYAVELSLEQEMDGLYIINNKQAAYVLKEIAAGHVKEFDLDNSYVDDEDWSWM